ncbi:MAG TPA: GyrI-like domain-containing protein [Methanocella sp.]|nr:GyrI-like domain-containing protein [Methanocella sp.]
MAKLDYKRELKTLYGPSQKPVIIDVPDLQYLMIDGRGYPGTSQEYWDSITALYPLAYALKFMIKKRQGVDYTVMPLQGLWWADDMSYFRENFLTGKDAWQWTSMIMQPDMVTASLFSEAVADVRKKKAPVSIDKVRLERYSEGMAAQILHIGPYSAEGPTIEKLHAFIEDIGYIKTGKHHEIYLSDPRKAAAEKLKTVIRQPVAKG